MVSCANYTKENLPISAPKEFNAIRDEIIQLVESGKTPAFSIAVLQNGEILWQEAFEKSKDSLSFIISDNGQFPIASMTKSMTATVLMKLYEEGKVSLDDKISKYLPNNFNNLCNTNSTIKELLTMTAGIPHGGISAKTDHPFSVMDNDSLIKNNYGMTVFPRGIYEYSNFSYGILEAIIEKITKQPYNVVLNEKLFKPLKMKNSFVESYTNKSLKNGANIQPHLFSSKFYPSGGAGVYSTLEDLISYAKLNLEEQDESVIAHKALKLLHYEKTIPTSITALGWGSIRFDDNTSWILSNGSFPLSANSHISILPEHQIAVVCLANRDYNSMADIMAIKAIDVLLNGFADKAFSFMQNYEQEKTRPFSINNKQDTKWEGTLKNSSFEIPIKFRLDSIGLSVSVDENQWQSIENITMDDQSLVRGRIKLPLLNPFTKTIEETTGSINILIRDEQLEGYYSASFPNTDFVFLELPYYIKAILEKPKD